MKRRLIALAYLMITLGCVSCNPDPKTLSIGSGNQEISVSIIDDPQVLDPRLVRDTSSVNISHMLFEGLMRKNYTGKIAPALASSYTVSEDGKIYTFILRDSAWSDGTPLTADDFEYTWKSILDPAFPAPNAYQLYVIQGAKAAKTGEGSVEDVGVKAIDAQTLVVTLEKPLSYFLELTTTHFFSPISKTWAESVKGEQFVHPETIVTNGPFKLDSWKREDTIAFVKNPLYWDHKNVKLDKINLVISDENTALQMFERKQLDWAGSPMSMIPVDAIAALKSKGSLMITPAAGVHLFRLNTQSYPLNNLNLRKALALAIDRKSLVDHVTQSNQKPATGIVPLSFGLQARPYFEDNNVTKAWEHYQQALEELEISKDEMPALSLCYVPNERNSKIVQAVQRHWSEALGVNVKLDACESAIYFDRLGKDNYQISIGSWYGDINDPINFLEIFKFKDSSTNHTQWEDAEFISLLDQSSQESDTIQRHGLLVQAEAKLMSAMPVIPIYYPTFNYLNRSIVGVYFSELGYVDFTYAFKDESFEK